MSAIERFESIGYTLLKVEDCDNIIYVRGENDENKTTIFFRQDGSFDWGITERWQGQIVVHPIRKNETDAILYQLEELGWKK